MTTPPWCRDKVMVYYYFIFLLLPIVDRCPYCLNSQVFLRLVYVRIGRHMELSEMLRTTQFGSACGLGASKRSDRNVQFSLSKEGIVLELLAKKLLELPTKILRKYGTV